jgi:indoleamine 2,3-dioxygenase
MLEMRESLPSEFQSFIKALYEAPNIREFCLLHAKSNTGGCIEQFNRACANLKAFRDLHLQVATHYIILQKKSDTAVGTGGTDLVPFLKQVRSETGEAVISTNK